MSVCLNTLTSSGRFIIFGQYTSICAIVLFSTKRFNVLVIVSTSGNSGIQMILLNLRQTSYPHKYSLPLKEQLNRLFFPSSQVQFFLVWQSHLLVLQVRSEERRVGKEYKY